MDTKRIVNIVASGTIAGMFVACSGGVANEAAQMLEDAATRILDGGSRDAAEGPSLEDARSNGSDGRIARDSSVGTRGDSSQAEDSSPNPLEAAGQALSDISTMIRDGSNLVEREANAQSCATCTASGVVRVVTADTDPSRFESGYERDPGGGGGVERVAGPFVLTDARMLSSTGGANIGHAPPGECETERTPFLSLLGTNWAVQGARLLIPSGRVMCLSATPGVGVYWSGFRPYD